MVELIRSREIDIPALKKEKSEYIQEQSGEFQLNVMLLYLIEEYPAFGDIRRGEASRMEDGNVVRFEDVLDEDGNRRTIRCSNVSVHVGKEE